ncbi:MAG TPA: Lpg1974 family pore-forming outer membrane protein [Gemmatales bacterium]|nr:Lpg1974 family pore-forming outer membrane protein [Gemmatales bacterium]HMP57919.1 Lpg1974 family pore-forming outer membrane protein [Gemmatales bacterium]
MARWKALMLAGVLGCPAVCSAQGLPMPEPAMPRPAYGSSFMPGPGPMPGAMAYVQEGAQAAPAPAQVAGGQRSIWGDCGDCGPVTPWGGCQDETTTGASGILTTGELFWMRMRRNDPVLLVRQISGGGGGELRDDGALTGYGTSHTIGFRVGGGYLCQNGLFYTVTYTRYRDSNAPQVFVSENPENTTSMLYVGPGVLGSAVTITQGVVQTGWDYDFQTVDLQAGAVFSPTSILDVIVQGGVRFGNLSQTYNTFILDTQAQAFNNETFRTILRGAGPRFGSEARVYLLRNLMIFGKGFTSLVLTNREESSVYANPNTLQTVTYTREEIMPMLEMATGFEVSMFNGHVLVGAAYEWNYFFQAGSSNVDLANNARINRKVDLSLDGVAVRLSLLW